MLFRRLKTSFIRLPKNLRSNRLWILWGGVLYIRTRSFPHIIGDIFESLEIEWSPSVRFYRRPLINFSRKEAPRNLGLLVTEMGRFGNMVRRLANALVLSSVLRVQDVIVPSDVIFHHEIFPLLIPPRKITKDVVWNRTKEEKQRCNGHRSR